MTKGICNAYIWQKSKDDVVTLMIDINKKDFDTYKMYKKKCEVNFDAKTR